MWLVWSCIAIVLFAFCEIYEKKGSVFEEQCSETKLLVWFGIFGLIFAFSISVMGLRESNEGIISMIMKNPVFILSPIFYFLSLLLAFISLKFIPVSVEVPITNTDGILCFIGAILLYAFRGKFVEIAEDVSPIKLILVVIVTITAFIFSVMYEQKVESGEDTELVEKIRKQGNKTSFIRAKLLAIIGIICAVLSAMFDAGDSVILYYILDEVADSYDYLYFSNMMYAIFGLLAWIYVSVKLKKLYNPFEKGQGNKALGAFFDCAGTVVTVFAVAENPFLSDPLISTYFVFTVLLSRIILKEKLSLRQYVCIAILLCGIFAFAILDV